jgi:hypothetical protein
VNEIVIPVHRRRKSRIRKGWSIPIRDARRVGSTGGPWAVPDGTCLWFLFRFVSLSMFLPGVIVDEGARVEGAGWCREVPVEPLSR